MDRQIIPDLILQGMWTAAGGRYRRVRMEGMGKVAGDVAAQEMLMNGMATVQGSLECDTLEVNGKLKTERGLTASSAKLEGFITVQSSAAGQRFDLRGMLIVTGNCDLEQFESEGAFEIGGMLNAGSVNLSLYGKSSAREIGCESIRVRKVAKSQWKRLLEKMIPGRNHLLQADTIEGDDIDLEYTVASVVRGDKVRIGPGCRIGQIEFRREFIKHPSAQVGEERKIGDGNQPS